MLKTLIITLPSLASDQKKIDFHIRKGTKVVTGPSIKGTAAFLLGALGLLRPVIHTVVILLLHQVLTLAHLKNLDKQDNVRIKKKT